MFCIVAFVILSILGIFSASNRVLAREALDCVFRRVTLRPCNTGFDEKMKARLLGVVITRSESAAVVLNKNFELLSWIFFVLLMASSFWFVRGVYLFYTTGSCNGANSSAFCVFDPTGANNQVSTIQKCTTKPATESGLSLEGVDISTYPALNPSAREQVVMIGCYHCDYTRKAYPMIRALVKRYNAGFTFFNYPVKEETDYFTRLSYTVYKVAPEKFWEFNDLMFTGDKADLDNPAHIDEMLVGLGLDPQAIVALADDPLTETAVKAQMDEAVKTGFYGTPTIFIHEDAFVGPKPYRVYAIALKGLLYWLR